MPILSPKRQVTLPKQLCDRLQVQPGDDLEFLEHNGRLTIIKKIKDSSAGILKTLKPDNRYSEQASLEDSLRKRRPRLASKRRVA